MPDSDLASARGTTVGEQPRVQTTTPEHPGKGREAGVSSENRSRVCPCLRSLPPKGVGGRMKSPALPPTSVQFPLFLKHFGSGISNSERKKREQLLSVPL